jgi:hypothetical protein
MEKPKNYQPGGQEALNEKFKNNIPQVIFILSMIVWFISSLWITLVDVFNGFQHTVLTSSFILCSIIGIYLKVRQSMKLKKLLPGFKKAEGCAKCGKNKSK